MHTNLSTDTGITFYWLLASLSCAWQDHAFKPVSSLQCNSTSIFSGWMTTRSWRLQAANIFFKNNIFHNQWCFNGQKTNMNSRKLKIPNRTTWKQQPKSLTLLIISVSVIVLNCLSGQRELSSAAPELTPMLCCLRERLEQLKFSCGMIRTDLHHWLLLIWAPIPIRKKNTRENELI